jgi:hypothetical protein
MGVTNASFLGFGEIALPAGETRAASSSKEKSHSNQPFSLPF